MKLPGGEAIHVPQRKITEYLLSTTHPAGRGKAAWFFRHGFSQAGWTDLTDALRWHGATHPISNREETAFGIRYTVEGPLNCPDGRSPPVRSAWFAQPNTIGVLFVTAYPLRRSADDQGA